MVPSYVERQAAWGSQGNIWSPALSGELTCSCERSGSRGRGTLGGKKAARKAIIMSDVGSTSSGASSYLGTPNRRIEAGDGVTYAYREVGPADASPLAQ